MCRTLRVYFNKSREETSERIMGEKGGVFVLIKEGSLGLRKQGYSSCRKRGDIVSTGTTVRGSGWCTNDSGFFYRINGNIGFLDGHRPHVISDQFNKVRLLCIKTMMVLPSSLPDISLISFEIIRRYFFFLL